MNKQQSKTINPICSQCGADAIVNIRKDEFYKGVLIQNLPATYCQNCGEELYDLNDDPDELTNRAGDPAYAGHRRELRAALEDWMRRNDDPFLTYHRTTREGWVIRNDTRGSATGRV